MSSTVYYVLSAVLSIGVLVGIRWMSKVETAVRGNRLSALCMLIAICLVFIKDGLLSHVEVWVGLALGTAIGVVFARVVKMITMPQMVALLNGLGGAASAIAAWLTIRTDATMSTFAMVTAMLALVVGGLTFSGSLVAAGKLHRILPQKPIRLPNHMMLTAGSAIAMGVLIVLSVLVDGGVWLPLLAAILSLAFGLLFAFPVGGADMPITISLLNSTSGVAAAIAGMAINDVLLVAVGGIVGASGLLLTQIMCRAMNRNLSAIIFGKAPAKADKPKPAPQQVTEPVAPVADAAEAVAGDEVAAEAPAVEAPVAATEDQLPQWLNDAKDIIIIPGYGMAVSQAQELLKQLHGKLGAMGKQIRFAIHPVAGRMPGHMNVLLAEVDIPYDELHEMDDINPDMGNTDLVIVVGANDVINPAANTAEDTPIYGMPVLNAVEAKHLIICNFDTQPGYAGVPNPLYEPAPNIMMLLGDAKASIEKMLAAIS